MSPRHQRVDVFIEMTAGQLRKQVFQIGIWLDAIHFAGADQAGEARPVSTAFVVPGKKRVAAIHCRAADGIFDEIRVDVDATITKEEPEALFSA